MSCDPAVVELLGYQPESEYPFPINGSEERVFCVDEEPVTTPHGTFLVSTKDYAVTLTEGAPFGGLPTYRRWWYSAQATNRANIATITNVTARPLEVVLFVQAGQSFSWYTQDFDGNAGTAAIAKYDVGVLETSAGGTAWMTYAPYGTDAAVFQVNPTLEAIHYWLIKPTVGAGGISVEHDTATGMVFGKLPPLLPGRKYVAEPSIFVNGQWTDSTAKVGTYTNGRMDFGMFAWTARG